MKTATGALIDGTAGRYSRTAIALHWIVAAAILAQLVFGWFLGELPHQTPARAYAINLHKSTGMVIALLVLARLAWRVSHRPPPWPVGMPEWQRVAAFLTHALLYAAIIIMPLSGWVATNLSPHGIRFFNLVMLAPLGPDLPQAYRVLNGIHRVFAWVLVSLIVLHILAALKHALTAGDNVFMRMWFGKSGATRPRVMSSS